MSKRISGLWSSKPRDFPAPIVEPSRAVTVLPMDVFREIADHLPKLDVLALSSCSTELRTLLLPEIYAAVSLLCGSKACSSKIEILSRSPKLWGCIRKLDIGPDWLSWPIEASIEFEVASAIERMSSGLTNLETFTWCGIHPLPDNIWGALRKSCPMLRSLSYTAQIREFEPESQLFKFRNLLEFTLWVKDKAEAAPLVPPNLPPQLCDMLLDNPNLQHLNLRLCASHNNLASLSRLFQGTWENLSSFLIEICTDHPARSELAAFLAAHPKITSLSIFPHLPDTSPVRLDVETLPNLAAFTGISQQVYALPHVSSLRELVLLDSDIARDVPVVLAVLPPLMFLTSLTISFGNADNTNGTGSSILSNIVVACPSLESLEITYNSPCTVKQFKAISRDLHQLPFLHTLKITKIYRITDGTMLSTVLLLLEHNPGLRCIRLVWVTTKEWKQSGNYTVIPLTVNSVEVPDVLEAKEYGPRALAGSFKRDFRYALRGGDKVSKGLARIRR
ncbi:hypothetical protein MVEN_00704300 [Mycena venus]|uniref:F-box domain-containing protein n=1 Tax=Mycena venus TaxID=2733690 RepID=A0A8H6YIL9_9AGAR|nr:hypothetical protein MVEN_00704300 [Mycena venus]